MLAGRLRSLQPWIFFLLACASACGAEDATKGGADEKNGGATPEEDAGGAASDQGARCQATRAQYDEVRPLLEQWCGTCHGASPAYGAPFSLLDYDSVLGRYGDSHVIDRMAVVLAGGSMPPAEQPQPDEPARAALHNFASCGGTTHPALPGGDGDGGAGNPGDAGTAHQHEPPAGLKATRTPLMADDTPPAGATSHDLTAGEYALAQDARDDYEDFHFSKLTDKDTFVRRFEPVIDDARVVHHLTLRFVNGGGYLFSWAPGGPAIEFPDGGIRIKPTDELVLQIHYNNGVGASDVHDSSGVRLYLADEVGSEYGLANLASWSIYVPDGTESSASAHCDVQNQVHVFAAAPHMHSIGNAFEHTITRKGGKSEDLVSLTGWTFSAQRYYAIGIDLAPGDALDMTCHYKNDSGHLVTAGEGTMDEMCFDFMYVTPPLALSNCNDPLSL
jgi:hypothetical protein